MSKNSIESRPNDKQNLSNVYITSNKMKRIINYACPTNDTNCLVNVYRGSRVNKSNCTSGKCVGQQANHWGTIGGRSCLGPNQYGACITSYWGISGNGVCQIQLNSGARAFISNGNGYVNQTTLNNIIPVSQGKLCNYSPSCMSFIASNPANPYIQFSFTSVCPHE